MKLGRIQVYDLYFFQLTFAMLQAEQLYSFSCFTDVTTSPSIEMDGELF